MNKVKINISRNYPSYPALNKSELKKRVSVKKENRESLTEDKRKILKQEINMIEEIIKYKGEDADKLNEDSKKIKEQEESKFNEIKQKIIDNLPILPIEVFSRNCVDICIKKPQVMFETIARYLHEYNNEMITEWEKIC